MGAGKSPPAGRMHVAVHTIRFLLRPQNRGLVLTVLVAVVALAGIVFGWQRWGAPMLESSEYLITADRIQITPRPAWIHADVKAEVLRAAGNDALHLQDRRVVEHLAQ